MEIVINYWAVLGCGVVSMVVGYIWYGPLFGKKWLRLMGVNPEDLAKCQEMQKAAGPLYGIQFLLSLFTAYVLAHYIAGWKEVSGVENSLWIWAAFVMPIVAGNALWSNLKNKEKWTMFLLGAGYQLVNFVLFGLILGW